MAMIHAWGPLSGLHINPAVTAAFTVRGVFPVRWVLPYWVVQFAGAIDPVHLGIEVRSAGTDAAGAAAAMTASREDHDREPSVPLRRVRVSRAVREHLGHSARRRCHTRVRLPHQVRPR